MIDVAQGTFGTDAHGNAAQLDFVMCIGDDSSDELMFQALHSKFGTQPADLDLFTVTVGRKPSEAQSYLGDHSEVVELLKMLSSIGNAKSKRFASMGDLVKLNATDQDLSPTDQQASRQVAGRLPPSRHTLGSDLPARPRLSSGGEGGGGLRRSGASLDR